MAPPKKAEKVCVARLRTSCICGLRSSVTEWQVMLVAGTGEEETRRPAEEEGENQQERDVQDLQ